MTLDGKVAIVTGASRGIGADISRHLARAGAAVVVAARSEKEPDPRLPGTIHSVAREITDAGGRALAVRTNMRNLDEIEALVARTLAHFGRIDIVVNNAAVIVPGDIEHLSRSHLQLMWEVDLRAPIVLLQLTVPHLKAGGGHIINISSRAAYSIGPGPYKEPGTGSFIYPLFKAAINRFSEALARDLQFSQPPIAVNVLSPMGRLRTPGNLFLEQDRDQPDLDFEPADYMGKAAVWICDQPTSFTGNVLRDEELCRAQGLV